MTCCIQLSEDWWWLAIRWHAGCVHSGEWNCGERLTVLKAEVFSDRRVGWVWSLLLLLLRWVVVMTALTWWRRTAGCWPTLRRFMLSACGLLDLSPWLTARLLVADPPTPGNVPRHSVLTWAAKSWSVTYWNQTIHRVRMIRQNKRLSYRRGTLHWKRSCGSIARFI